MSCNLFINSSIWNCSYAKAIEFQKYCLKHVKNPKIEFDGSGDMIIEEDFDRRHTQALLDFLKRN